MIFESAYLIQNKKINYWIKLILCFIVLLTSICYFYQYPKTIFYESLVISQDDQLFLRILCNHTDEIVNDNSQLIIDGKYYKYKIANIENINISNKIYYYVDLQIDASLILNATVKVNIYLGKTTAFKEIIKNLKKGITNGQT